ncbi:MAG: hypothetical protein ABS917_11410 [Solibacillus sp.]|uniref:hypothetical protein n=1 Tax=Solibacillus sp. TaxID=1909654 RepID=UPI0033146C0E
MVYNVQLNNGNIIELKGAAFDVEAFTNTLNNQQIVFVNLGGAIVNKHLIQAILPVQTENPV